MNSWQPFIERVINFVELGYPIFPLVEKRKNPLIEGGFKNASLYDDTIEMWNKNHPHANIGLSMAHAPLLIVDVDGKENPWLDKYREELFRDAVAIVETPSGWHFYFGNDESEPWGPSAGKVAKNIDIRVRGSYVVAPASFFEANEEELTNGKQTGHYTWHRPLEIEANRLPPKPEWLTKVLTEAYAQKMEAAAGSTLGGADVIEMGRRNDILYKEACRLRHFMHDEEALMASMSIINQKRCEVPVSEHELSLLVKSACVHKPSVSVPATIPEVNPVDGESVPQFDFKILTNKELAEGDFPIDYLIKDVLVKGQPCIIGAPKKTMKTSFSIDLALSLATGKPFLGHFEIKGKYRVGIMSAESGMGTLQETAKRMCLSKGITDPDIPLFWCSEVPHLDNDEHIAALIRFIRECKLDILEFDPAYMMLCGLGGGASNLFEVGRFLSVITEICQKTGITPIINHHTIKSAGRDGEPLELESIAFAGFQEWARQWLLLNRREKYNPDKAGDHKLWMTSGGSAGHTGCWGVDIAEGSIHDFGGRKWDVSITSVGNVYRERDANRKQSKEDKENEKREESVAEAADRIEKYLLKIDTAETRTQIRSVTGLNDAKMKSGVFKLLVTGVIVEIKFEKNGRKYDGVIHKESVVK